jgi:outer membrane biosynthesis protein TonB
LGEIATKKQKTDNDKIRLSLYKIKSMAVLHKKEEKIQAVLGRLPKKYTDEQFVEMFIRLYSKDWGKIKSAYIKQSQDKEPGTVINMPKPEVYLKQILANYLQQEHAPKAAEVKEELVVEAPVVEAKKAKAPPKKKVVVTEEIPAEVKKAKAPAKKKAEIAEEPVAEVKKVKAPAKKKAEVTKAAPAVEKKVKAAAKKPAAKK